MAKKKRLVLGLVLVGVALMSVFVPAVNAVSQDWYLCPDLTLNKTAPATTEYSFKGVSEWEAGPAQSNLTIGSDDWTLHLDCDTPTHATGKLYVEVWNATQKVANGFAPISSSGTVYIPMTGSRADFKKGESLKLKLNWSSDESVPQNLTVNCGNGESLLKSPSTDPGYPIPELNTFVLSSVGLIALAGYVIYRKKRT